MNTLIAKTAFATCLAAASPGAALASTAGPVVLLHGAFAAKSRWDKASSALRDKGRNVTKVANPLTSHPDAVAARIERAAHGP